MARTFIIAEAGCNHNGKLSIAKQLIDVAHASGADAVKFQAFKAERLTTATALKATYQVQNTGTNESQQEMLRALEVTPESHRVLLTYCKEKGILLISSPFDLESVEMLHELGLTILKIPSGEITNLPYLRQIGRLRKRLILSTGMSDLVEVETALRVLQEAGTPKEYIAVLHCHTDYPTAMEHVNLRAMCTMRKLLGVEVGYSDHTLGIEASIAAVALGATVIEKHFTLTRTMTGPDQRASLEPQELTALVRAIRNIEIALGDGVKRPTQPEMVISAVARKSIVAARDIYAGELFTEENLTVKRPGVGLNPMLWDRVIGQKAKKLFRADELIQL